MSPSLPRAVEAWQQAGDVLHTVTDGVRHGAMLPGTDGQPWRYQSAAGDTVQVWRNGRPTEYRARLVDDAAGGLRFDWLAS